MEEHNHPDSNVQTVEPPEAADEREPSHAANGSHYYLYYYHDTESGRITLTGFVSASSRRDARRRLRMMGLRT